MTSLDPTCLRIECYGQRVVDYLSLLSQTVKADLLRGKDVTLVRNIEQNGLDEVSLKIRLYFSPETQAELKELYSLKTSFLP